jgi:hypothetical protein
MRFIKGKGDDKVITGAKNILPFRLYIGIIFLNRILARGF